MSSNDSISTLSNDKTRPLRIAITTGEPAGVGPELMYHLTTQDPCSIKLTAHCASQQTHNQQCPVELVLIGNLDLLQERMSLYNKPFELHPYNKEQFQPSKVDAFGIGHVSCLNVKLKTSSQPGKLDIANAPYVLSTLNQAIRGLKKKEFDAVVTAPISKSVIAQTGVEFTGHTEYLQAKTKSKEVVMMLGCPSMNVALATTHLPLSKVSDAITQEKLERIITILHHDLQNKMGFAKPVIYICGLNPHAGEDGTLGRNEIEVMIPVIQKLQEQGMELRGPLPADTIFQKKYLDEASAILTMYHDQGLPVLKYAGFDQGYNTTLGLPFIRTSVDHGTALDLAGKAIADPGSLFSAVSLAIYMAQNHIRD